MTREQLQQIEAALEEALTDYHPNDAKIREALALLRSDAQGERGGWKLVPVEPTKEMLERGFSPFMAAFDSMFNKNEPCGPIYKAMIAAAPSTPSASDWEAGAEAMREIIAVDADAGTLLFREGREVDGRVEYYEPERWLIAKRIRALPIPRRP